MCSRAVLAACLGVGLIVSRLRIMACMMQTAIDSFLVNRLSIVFLAVMCGRKYFSPVIVLKYYLTVGVGIGGVFDPFEDSR